jgi:hypothetical protein
MRLFEGTLAMPTQLSPTSNSGDSLQTLRSRGHALIRALSEADQEPWKLQQIQAASRASLDKRSILSLIEEFKLHFCDELQYEHAFVCDWLNSNPNLYEARRWICKHTAGVYFIYDRHESLRYIGSSCVGELGFRLWNTGRNDYRHTVDVVLFDRPLVHFALAFEALAVSRIARMIDTLENREFRTLWIPPPPPFDSYWKNT